MSELKTLIGNLKPIKVEEEKSNIKYSILEIVK